MSGMLGPMSSVDEYLTTEEVCGRLASAGVDEATVGKVFAARLEPENLDEEKRARKFVMGVPAPDGQVFLLVYRFGPGTPLEKLTPLDEGGPDWRPRWLAVEGPFASGVVGEKARELTSDA